MAVYLGFGMAKYKMPDMETAKRVQRNLPVQANAWISREAKQPTFVHTDGDYEGSVERYKVYDPESGVTQGSPVGASFNGDITNTGKKFEKVVDFIY